MTRDDYLNYATAQVRNYFEGKTGLTDLEERLRFYKKRWNEA